MKPSISCYKILFLAKSSGKDWGQEGHCLCLVPAGWLPHRSFICVTTWGGMRMKPLARAPQGPVPHPHHRALCPLLGLQGQWVLGGVTLGPQCLAFLGIKYLGSHTLPKRTENQLVAEGQGSPGHTPLDSRDLEGATSRI